MVRVEEIELGRTEVEDCEELEGCEKFEGLVDVEDLEEGVCFMTIDDKDSLVFLEDNNEVLDFDDFMLVVDGKDVVFVDDEGPEDSLDR